jgi:hypothetical protein
MKKLFTTLFAVLGIYTLAHAQQSKGTEFGIGIGYSAASVSANSQNTKSKSGFNVALSADNYFSDRWSLKVKAVYDQKGWAGGFLTTPTTTYSDVNYSLNYITVPVMANWHFGKTRKWYLDFGPYAGFLLDAKVTKYPESVKEAFNTVDGGLAFGIGVKLPISEKTKFYIEYDGQGGMTNLFKNSQGSEIHSVRSSFNIGLNF